jgi:hypothetical protein
MTLKQQFLSDLQMAKSTLCISLFVTHLTRLPFEVHLKYNGLVSWLCYQRNLTKLEMKEIYDLIEQDADIDVIKMLVELGK